MFCVTKCPYYRHSTFPDAGYCQGMNEATFAGVDEPSAPISYKMFVEFKVKVALAIYNSRISKKLSTVKIQ